MKTLFIIILLMVVGLSEMYAQNTFPAFCPSFSLNHSNHDLFDNSVLHTTNPALNMHISLAPNPTSIIDSANIYYKKMSDRKKVTKPERRVTLKGNVINKNETKPITKNNLK